MDKRLNLSKEQKNNIVSIICEQCKKHLSREEAFSDLTYRPYAGNRGEHSITLSVLSGFRPEKDKILGLQISIQKYGLNNRMGQPVLTGENVVLHIYNSGCGFKSLPFREGCKKNTKDKTVFACIVFTADNKGILKSINLKIPDSNGDFVYNEVLYQIKINKN